MAGTVYGIVKPNFVFTILFRLNGSMSELVLLLLNDVESRLQSPLPFYVVVQEAMQKNAHKKCHIVYNTLYIKGI